MPFGVHSEVGRLLKVIIHRPGLEHSRLNMHLDTVITMCDRDLVTLFPQVVYGARG